MKMQVSWLCYDAKSEVVMKRYVERDGKFYARVTFKDSAGKERQIWRRAENKSHAKDLANELERELKQGSEPFEHKGNLEEYLDKWLASQQQKVSERTYEDYRNILRLHVRPTLGKKKLASIKPLDVQEMADHLKAKG